MRCEKGTFFEKHAFGAHFPAMSDTVIMTPSLAYRLPSNSIEVNIDE
jgi:hypothetical protein